ncbi:cadherin-like beta sandwich domain-containing protein [Paenibacillus xylanexedens]|uniref:cadherin-like beta sandwich domain-containing protein n=1 Tax=Paenibacillus xylanexedens TaxID=528191 RepID=UPI001F248FDA|nr:cadherin-like beta sandwich domain-containing protein [Paenibacillus xylanexedens]MCF7756073.1 cadherin-like beta sandwich domain-containing protein [Paenibacillus xylanexedens]
MLALVLVVVLSGLPNWAMASPVNSISGLTLSTLQGTITTGKVKIEGLSGGNTFWATPGQGNAELHPEEGSSFSSLADLYSINVSYNPFVPAIAGNTISVVEVDSNNVVVGYTTLVVDATHIGTVQFVETVSADPVMTVGANRGFYSSDLYNSPNPTEFGDIVISDTNVVSFEWRTQFGVTYPYFQALALGTTNVSIEVRDTVTQDKNTRIMQFKVVSSNSKLSDLTIAGQSLAPDFDSNTNNYTVNVSNDTDYVNISPTVAEMNATVKVNGLVVTSGSQSDDIGLSVGATTINVKVTAHDGYTVSNYDLTVNRAKSSNAKLDNLATSVGALDPIFTAGTTDYSLNVNNNVTHIKVTPTVAEINATVKVNGQAVASGSQSDDIELSVGATTINVEVTAQDGMTVSNYEITVNRAKSSNANLDSLATSVGALEPVFTAGTTDYSLNVGNDVTRIKVTPTVAEINATVKVNGQAVTSGSQSDDIELSVGATTINVEVTAQDGITVSNYVVTVTRDASSIADLAGLALSQGTLSPAFAADTTSYSASVVNTISSVTITPTVAESNAIISVSLNDGTATPVISGAASVALALNVGDNTIKVEVTAQNETTKTYTIIVTRAAAITSSPGGGGGGGSPAPSNTPVVSTNGKLTIPSGRTGEVSLDNVITVIIPGGATNKELILTVEKLSNTQSLLPNNEVLASPIYEILKSFSEDFIKPVVLTFTFDPAAVKGNEKAVVFYYDEVKKGWVKVGGKVDGNKISVEVNHFTKFAVMAVSQAEDVTPTDPTATDPTTSVSFSDITGHWAEANIKQAVSSGIVKGYLDGTFKPGKTVTRAEFAVMLMNALKPQVEGVELVFTDKAKIGAWAQKAVAQAVQVGIINGYADGTFSPSAEVTRAEMAVMIAKALGQSNEANAVTSFADDKDIPAWAKGSIAYVKQAGIVNGKGVNMFAPQDEATRAEAVTVLLNMLAQKK